jgi:hypothetical protein
LQRKSTVCGLNGLRTRFAGFPLFKSSTAFRALAPRPLYAVLKRQLAFPFWKQKLRFEVTFLSKAESVGAIWESISSLTSLIRRRSNGGWPMELLTRV